VPQFDSKLLFYTNRCIDKQEAKERECKVQQEMIEAAKHVVLNCPMCGKVCNTHAVSVKNLVLGFSTLFVILVN